MAKVLITGATGFLGSAVVKKLIENGYDVIATRRPTTNLFRGEELDSKIKWVNTDDDEYKQKVIDFSPDIIFHGAWSGVSSKERSDWNTQIKNFELLNDVLDIAKKSNVKKIFALGSQAEYSVFNIKPDETYPVDANDAYSACKLATQKILETFSSQNNIDWYWLRVFSVFGPGEAEHWFIPWVIKNQLMNTNVDLTLCEQQYDYLYIADFAEMMLRMISAKKNASGIYNICSGKAMRLKSIVEEIGKNIKGSGHINYGAIAYRPNQSMYLCGDNGKYIATFGAITITDIKKAIDQTINFYKNKQNKSK